MVGEGNMSVRERNEQYVLDKAKRKNKIKKILKGINSPNTGVRDTYIIQALELLLNENY